MTSWLPANLWLEMGTATPSDSTHLSVLRREPFFFSHVNRSTILYPSFAGFYTYSFPLLRKTHLAPVHASPLPETKPPIHGALSVTLSRALVRILLRIPSILCYMIHPTKAYGIKN